MSREGVRELKARVMIEVLMDNSIHICWFAFLLFLLVCKLVSRTIKWVIWDAAWFCALQQQPIILGL